MARKRTGLRYRANREGENWYFDPDELDEYVVDADVQILGLMGKENLSDGELRRLNETYLGAQLTQIE